MLLLNPQGPQGGAEVIEAPAAPPGTTDGCGYFFLNQVLYRHKEERNNVISREILKIEIILLNKRSHIQKDTYHIFSLVYGIYIK